MNPITFSERLNICLESDAALAATEAELSIAEYMAEMGDADEATMEAIFKTKSAKKQSWWKTIKDRVSAFVQAVIEFCKKAVRSIKLFFVKEDIKRTSSKIDKLKDAAMTKGVSVAKKTAAVVAPIAVSTALITFISKQPFDFKAMMDTAIRVTINSIPGAKDVMKAIDDAKNAAKDRSEEAKDATEVDFFKDFYVGHSGNLIYTNEAVGSKDIYKQMTPDEIRKWLKTGSDFLMREALSLSNTLKPVENKLDLMKDTESGATNRRVLVECYDAGISMIRDRLRVLKATINHMK